MYEAIGVVRKLSRSMNGNHRLGQPLAILELLLLSVLLLGFWPPQSATAQQRGDGSLVSGDGAAGAASMVTHDGKLDRKLLDALNFRRENSRDMAAAFDPDRGMLAGFGANLLQYDLATNTSQLFAAGRLVVTGADTETEEGDLDATDEFVPGDKLTLIQTIQTVDGVANSARLTVEPIFDRPSLIESRTTASHKNAFSGSFRIVIEAGELEAEPTLRIETVYDAAADSFPLGFAVVGEPPPFDPRFEELLAIGDRSFREPMGLDRILNPSDGLAE